MANCVAAFFRNHEKSHFYSADFECGTFSNL